MKCKSTDRSHAHFRLTGNAILRAHWEHYTNNKSAAAIGATGSVFAGLIIVLLTAPFVASGQSVRLPWPLAVIYVIIFSLLTGTIGSKILTDCRVDLGGIDILRATRAGAVGGAIFGLEAGYVLPLIISPLYTLIMNS